LKAPALADENQPLLWLVFISNCAGGHDAKMLLLVWIL
jgi:hypothetical protein